MIDKPEVLLRLLRFMAAELNVECRIVYDAESMDYLILRDGKTAPQEFWRVKTFGDACEQLRFISE